MQVTVEIPEELAARAAQLGLTPEAYVHDLLVRDIAQEGAWIQEAQRRAEAIDSDAAKVVSWEEIEARLRSRIAG